MTISAVILECNPFHEGHAYLLKRAKENSDYLIAVMSGDFVQRGIPAVYAKEVRTRDVLSIADVVVELPVFASTGSADLFARGAVDLAVSLGCVTDLYFGSESGDLSLLWQEAGAMESESPAFQAALRSGLSSGLSYPAARSAAKQEVTGSPALSSPNDLLGACYLRYLDQSGSSITPHAVQRIRTKGATEIREEMLSGRPGPHPECTALSADDFSELLLARLFFERNLSDYLDVSPDLARKIQGRLGEYRSFTQFAVLLKSKDLAYTRISRSLLHVLLDIRKKEAEVYFSTLPYGARILGFRKDREEILHLLSKESRIPIIVRPTDAKDRLCEDARALFEKNLLVSELYDQVVLLRSGGTRRLSEYQKQVIRI